jgi:putative zinc finger/helix-turn-helix YgiT family protein
MIDICANCEKEAKIELISVKEPIEVRGEIIKVDTQYFKCTECGEEFENTRGYDALEVAYREYRRRHEMLQPEAIREWRKRYGLTQQELTRILGWGGATLNRYENGALQDEAHEKMLRLAMDPHNLLKLIKEEPKALNPDKYDRLISELSATEEESCSLDRIFEERFGDYPPDELSGYKRLQLTKLFNAILFFCQGEGGQLKTKLNKLLFYADFKHFKHHTVSITGAHYIHLQYGPVPDRYDFYFAELKNEGSLENEETLIGSYIGDSYKSIRDPDLSIFNDSEKETLNIVNNFFKDYSSSAIRDFSHNELAYMKTSQNNFISYEYAIDLKI